MGSGSELLTFLVDYDYVRYKFKNIGIIGRGRDPFLELTSMNYLVQETFLVAQKPKQRIMQVFQELNDIVFNKKLEQLSQAYFEYYVPQNLNILMMAEKQNQDKTKDLVIIYEFYDIQYSLQELIQQKIQSGASSFGSEEQIWEIVYLIIDSLQQGGKLSMEYLDIGPHNIFKSQSETPLKYFISNLGLEVSKQFEIKLHNPGDKIFNVKTKERTVDMFIRNLMFQLGMLVLYLQTLQNPSELYNELYNNELKINEEKLQKRIESCKSQVSEQLYQFIVSCLQVKEERRLDLDQLHKEKSEELLPRGKTLFFHQGPLNDAKYYSGFTIKKDNAKFMHGIGDLLTEGIKFKGTFDTGVIQGLGIVKQIDRNLFAIGEWSKDEIKVGTLIQKDEFIYFGPMLNFNVSDVGLQVITYNNKKTNYFCFEGKFDQDGKYTEQGYTLYKDLKVRRGAPMNNIQIQKYDEEEEAKRQLQTDSTQ